MENKVFLGGTCADTTWREELIPFLKMDYFNPVVENWTEECVKIENDEKENKCNIHLYVITSAMKGVYSIAEIFDSMYSGKITIVQIVPDGFDEHQLKSLKQVVNLANKKADVIISNSFGSLVMKLCNFNIKDIIDLKSIINDHNINTENISNKVKTIIQNKKLPLDQRWDLFVESGCGENQKEIESFNLLEEFGFLNGDVIQRYETVDLIEILNRIQESDLSDITDKEFDKLVEDYKEEVLDKFIRTFIFDW